MVRIDDIAYGSDPAWQVLDVYRPRSAGGEKLPVIVSVHGGGWVYANANVLLAEELQGYIIENEKKSSSFLKEGF